MSKARQLADLGNVYDDGALSNRNLIINGAMQVWQRGTSHAAGSGIVYTADRFWRYTPSATGTIERSTDVPAGFEYSLYFNTVGGGNLGTSVELTRQGFFPQQQYTLSLYLKGDFSSASLYVNFRNSAGSGTDTVDITTLTSFGNYTDWTRVSFLIDTTGISPNANNNLLNLEFGGFPQGGKITGVQLEIGDTSTPFEHRSYADQLQACQRYFQTFGTSSGSAYGTGAAYRGSTYLSYTMPVTPRATPTLSSAGLWQTSTDGGSYTNRTPSLGGFQGNQLLITAWSGGGYDQDTMVYGRLNLDAEL